MGLKYCHEHKDATVTWVDDCRGICPVCERIQELEARKTIFLKQEVAAHDREVLNALEEAESEIDGVAYDLRKIRKDLEERLKPKEKT